VALFLDASRLERYDSVLRTRLTHHFREHLRQVSRIDVLVKSRIVAMGVAVASLALGGIVKSRADTTSFRSALEAELRERRVAGFSADLLGR